MENKWSNEQLCENENDNNDLYEKKSMENRCHMKAWKEAERQRVEEEMRQKAEEEEKQKAEVKAQRRVEAEAQVRTEEVVWAQSSVSGPSKGKQPKVAASRAGGGSSPMLWMRGCWGSVQAQMQAARGHAVNVAEEAGGGGDVTAGWEEEGADEEQDNEEDDNEEAEAEEEHDTLGALTEVAVVVTEMHDMATDRRHAAAESHTQTEQMLGILEEIQGCLDPEFALEEPEVGLEEDFKEEEVAEATEEREALKGWSEEEVEVDESM
ncbi:hypothetical protein PAXRUDRAFT_9658 [Paxillus rubicundulus Ve08.2h10]|uniref:Uncharacterized protein n=1 Tax=Paxillus rubicundulus Ve08.2h10 TaxID=930991 RepID=A0A0D0E2M5_9AGAM|nr:hypothetical protein PAXRUDRAFT_9658 [Paxillus rubicundulus Ve08.2h10]